MSLMVPLVEFLNKGTTLKSSDLLWNKNGNLLMYPQLKPLYIFGRDSSSVMNPIKRIPISYNHHQTGNVLLYVLKFLPSISQIILKIPWLQICERIHTKPVNNFQTTLVLVSISTVVSLTLPEDKGHYTVWSVRPCGRMTSVDFVTLL